MNKRAELLAQRIEEGASEMAALAEGLSEAQWRTVVRPDGRTVGVLVHHVASLYPIEVQLASQIAGGKPVEGITWDVVADMNARHALENAGITRQA